MNTWDFIVAYKKSLTLVVAITLLAGYYVYASTDRTQVQLESLKVVPDTVNSEYWVAPHNALSQDLTGEALTNEFNSINSSILTPERHSLPASSDESVESNTEVENVTETIGIPDGDSSGALHSSGEDDIEEGSSSPEVSSEQSNADQAPSVTEVPSAESDTAVDEVPTNVEITPSEPANVETPSEPADDETSDESAPELNAGEVSYSFPLVHKIYSFAVATLSELPLDETLPEVEETPESEVAQEVEPKVEPEVEISTSADDSTQTAEVTSEPGPDGAGELGTTHAEPFIEEPSEILREDSDTSAVQQDDGSSDQNPQSATSSAGQQLSVVDPAPSLCGITAGCIEAPIEFSGFLVPSTVVDASIQNVQLRVSMAGFPHNNASGVPSSLHVQYTFGDHWENLDQIDLSEEFSNALNGGYLLYALPLIDNTDDLQSLRVRFVYVGGLEDADDVYIDGLWLEVNALTLYEPYIVADELDVIEYTRELKEPLLNNFSVPLTDIALSDTPEFNLQFQDQRGVFKRAIDFFFGDQEGFTVSDITLEHERWGAVPVDFDLTYHEGRQWTATMVNKPQKIRPGKYKVYVTITENEDVFVDEFEFYWGVLAINTTRSRYFPGDEVTLNLAALTDRGDTICDANLELQVVTPDHSIHDVSIYQSGYCGDNNVTDKPDYIAKFNNTNELGTYTLQLKHKNENGEVVHFTTDSFAVEEFIPYDIERVLAPTRIYPPAPYEVKIEIEAHRSFEGDITERVPRGFVITDYGDATVTTLPTHTEIIWHDINLDEGDKLRLEYSFDAPDVSPYLYLLGPLDMDGFAELRSWQIASDAITAVAWLTGNSTTGGTELNDSSDRAMLFGTSTLDSLYFSHSTTSNSERLTFEHDGDYFISFTLPYVRNDATTNRLRIENQIYLNGSPVSEGVTRSSYTSNSNNHNESSNHLNFLLTDIEDGDYVEVYSRLVSTYNASVSASIDGQAGLYVEYVGPGETVFAATSTLALTGASATTTDLNQASPVELLWTEQRQDTGFVHSDTVSAQDITISNAGVYMVHVNIPIDATDATQRMAPVGRVRLNGSEVPGGQLKQGYIRGTGSNGDGETSLHYSGVVVATTSNQVLTITTEQEASAGVVQFRPGSAASIFIQEMPSDDIIVVRGTQLETNSNEWNPATAAAIEWETQDQYDTAIYTHSTSSNPADITVDEAGDYFLTFNVGLVNGATRDAPQVRVEVDGNPVPGATSKTGYMRGNNGHIESSLALTYMLSGLASSSVINVMMERGGNTGTVDDATNAVLMLWKKAELNLRPDNFAFYDAPFDSVRFASTTPYFEFSALDPDGTSNLQYQISISTTTDFIASTTRTSGVDSGFSNQVTPADTSPFTEGERIRFVLQSGDALDDDTTYYWRIRAMDVGGSDEYGDWSTVHSLTVDLAAETPYWYQTFDGQFETDELVGSRVSGNDSVEVDVVENPEILFAYAENNNATPRYQLWNGSNWGAENSAASVGSPNINWLVTAAGTTRDEYVLVTLGSDSDINAQIYSASTTSWGDLYELETDSLTNTTPGIAATYETISGEAMVIGCSSTADPTYALWNGSSWHASGTINVSTATGCAGLKIASNPTSDEIIMIHRGTGDSYEAQVWDGSAWSDSQVLGLVGSGLQDFDVIYEESGNQAIAVSADAGDNEFVYSTWDGNGWTTPLPIAHNADFENGKLKRDSGSDSVALCLIDSSSDVQAIIWDGDAWGSYQELTAAGNSLTGRPVDCEFETAPGRDGYLVAPYSDGTDDQHQVYDGSWSGEQAGSDLTDGWFVTTARAGDGTIVSVHMIDQGTTGLYSTEWNGSSWSNSSLRESTPAGISPNPRLETYSLSAKQYLVDDGTIRTNPIDFNFVPNQLTWGDVSFSVTEPVGTDATLQIYYTNVSTCDTLIPDGALTGNSTGFTSTSSPIDISGLSTTTYDQLCLQATLTTTGGNIAELNDWSLSWVREPKLTQNNYRWYTNLSSLTPTDAWPAGVLGVDENEAISSDIAVSDGQELRLRLSVQGGNVDLPAESDAFVLQYGAKTNECSLVNEWYDVGGIGSTTALWRGYANAIVGDDWLDEDWGRRIAITIDSDDVAENLTDFPVYVDMSTLPSGFFANVQNDGDDIRITEEDGVTEVPFELVSIDTGGELGELHFKANSLSSTTDSVFYIYYGNAGASGYSASATYGSQNVWTNGYDLRYALDEDPTGSVPQFKDSTANSIDAAARSGMTTGDVVDGQLGQAINHDGNDGGIFETALAYSGVFSASMWWRASGDGFAISMNSGSTEKMGPWNSPAGRIFARTISSSDTSVTHPADGTWTHVVLTRDSSNKVDIYLNGTRSRLYSDAAQSGTSDWENFGGQTTQGFIGDLDELRFADVKRSNGWVTTEYNNQANPAGFYDVSGEELISDGRGLPSTLLSDSDNAETYEEENPTRENQNVLTVGDDSEWDFVLENNGAAAGAAYCFRMVYADGGTLFAYSGYPELVTNGPPDAPELFAPFDNEQLASTSPWFEFVADDPVGDEVTYQIQVDADYNFGSPDIDNDSLNQFLRFENIADPSDKNPFTSGATIRYIPTASLTHGTTYWWRVRAQDPDASGAWGDWSTPSSFTVDTGTTITTWFQTTDEQFDTDDLMFTEFTGSDSVDLQSGETSGTTTSSAISYDDIDSGNAWGAFDYSANLNGGSLRFHIEYEASSNDWALIPDSDLPGNAAGFSSGPVTLVSLDTDVYRVLRVVAAHDDTGGNPELLDWTVTWGERVEVPTLNDPFDNAKVATTTPTLEFFTTDPDADDLQYEIQLSGSSSFAASSTFLSGVDTGFSDISSSTASSPFPSGDVIQYQVQSPLSNNATYWWRVRARDPLGDNTYSLWSDPQSFTVDTAITVSTWFQTTGEQFDTNTNDDIETTGTDAQITSTIREAMVVYSELGSYLPKYRTWNGSEWGTEDSAVGVDAYLVFSELEAAPTRNEYALATLGDDSDLNLQIFNGASSTWGNLLELSADVVEYSNDNRPFDIAYEQTSGNLIVVACDGTEAEYAEWNGTSWSATSSISLSSANECRWVQLASDPSSNEIMAGFRHLVNDTGGAASPVEFEFQVWNGSSWGNAITFGQHNDDDTEGMTVAYEASGDDAVVIVGDRVNNQFLYDVWDGSSWAGPNSAAIGNDFRWGTFAIDDGTDNLLLCTLDIDSDFGVIEWNGGGWGTHTEHQQAAPTIDARPLACEYQAQLGTDGNAFAIYSNNTEGLYQEVIAGVPQGEVDIGATTDRSDSIVSVRTGDGVILAGYNEFDNPDSYRIVDWDGSTWSETAVSSGASDTTRPFTSSLALAARKYPNFTSGSIRSTTIDYDDGTGPRWEQVLFSDDTPGASVITYRVYYDNAGTYQLVPDGYLTGNSTGFTTSPIDLSALDREIHNELQLQADFACDSGDCPTLYDWAVEWSEGITVSGIAYENDESTVVTSGDVAVAVNGVLQVGKTGTIAGDGSWSINNVTVFDGDVVTVFIDSAADADEAIALTEYDGNGDIAGMELSRRHLTIGSADEGIVVTNAEFLAYDFTDDEDVFFVDLGSNQLDLCGDAGCEDSELKILAGATYQPSANSTIHDFENNGTIDLDTTTLRVSGSWENTATTTFDTSTVIFTATTSTESISGTSTHRFNNVTFGESSGAATWNLSGSLDLAGALTASYGTLNRSTSSLFIAGNLLIGAGGSLSGLGTTTFDGTGIRTWTDNSASSSNLGYVVVNGTSKTVTISSDVRATTITVGADDILRGGTGNDVYIHSYFRNNNSFVADTSNVTFVGTSTTEITNPSAFYNLTFSGAGGQWYFTTTNQTVSNNLTIATGTVTFPSGILSIGGSFTNATGTFQHNNGITRFTSTTGGKTITVAGTSLYNAFYDLQFTGTGAWTMQDAATTSNDFSISAGTLTLPSSTLTVAKDFTVSGSGSFVHNSGEVILLVSESDTVTPLNSSFYDLTTRGSVSSSWYNDSWSYRLPVTLDEAAIDEDLTDFPVYVDLADLPSTFFSSVLSSGADIRVTEGDGVTEVPYELVSINTSTEVGELYFRASSVSSTTDTTYYLYFGNAGASAYAQNDTYGENNVWTNGYVLVHHMDDLTTSSIENSEGSPDGTKTSANNPLESTSGKIYDAQDFSGDSIAHTDIVGNQSNFSFSAWVNADNLTGSGDTATYGYSIFGISPSGAPYTWLTAGGTGFTSEFRICAWENSATACSGTSGSGLSTGAWNFVSVSATDGGNTTVRVNGTQRLSYTNAGTGALGTNFTLGDLRPARNINWDGRMDEVRVGNVTRSNAWRDAEYRNTNSTASFYTVGAVENPGNRSFTSTNATVLNDLTIEAGGDVTLPSGILSIGGSLSNSAAFYSNNGTVRFNSSDTGETIDAGESSFATLQFSSATGGWDFTADATSTVLISLAAAGDLELPSGRTLTALGSFTTAVGGASTTWDGVLQLVGGTDYAINSKTAPIDTYNTLRISGDGDISAWNSSASTYDLLSTASFYSQDHAGNDGDLYIFGDYVRSSGNEYWRYNTDFDGTALSGMTTRGVDVRLANGANFTLSGGSLSILGSSTASTTIDSQAGTYGFDLQGGSTTARYYEFTGMDASGVNITGGTTIINSLSDGQFTISTPGGTGITLASTTIDGEPGKQLYRVGFATTSAISASNVTLANGSVATSFWWFREAWGNLAGEAFDASDGNPGSVRWDDSSYLITVSGVLYEADGVTPYATATAMRLIIDGDGGTPYDTTTTAGTGAFSFANVAYVGDPVLTVFANTNGAGPYASLVTKTPTADINDLKIVAGYVTTRHEDIVPLSITDMDTFDGGDDTDIRFAVSASSTDTLIVRADNGLWVASSTTFTPAGEITLESGGTGTEYDGSLVIDENATLTFATGESHEIGGSFEREAGATFTAASSSIAFTATTSGKSITSADAAAIQFADLSFTGVGGGWNLNADLSIYGDLTVATGTVTGTGDIVMNTGTLGGDGLLSLGGGTVSLLSSTALGGSQGWTFNNLTLGDGVTVGTTTRSQAATTTVLGTLTIASAHTLEAGSSTWDLAGTGVVFVKTGVFDEGASTIQYSGGGATSITATNYHNLIVDSPVGSPTFTALGLGLQVFGDLTVGQSGTTTVNFTTNDPALNVDGDFLVGGYGTFIASDIATMTLAGNYTNNGTFTSSGGLLVLDGSGTRSIAAGASSFGDLTIDATGSVTFTEHATTTGILTYENATDITVAPNQTLAVGGQFSNLLGGTATTWTNATLRLYGGSYLVNQKTVSDNYGTLEVAANTDIRMWNSSASTTSVDASGSLYSQDHDSANGELYIFGGYERSSGTDYWSYATDFDGTDLTVGSNERPVSVFIEVGGSITYSGGTLAIVGVSTGTTTIAAQGVGDYAFGISGGTINAQYYAFSDLDSDGVTLTGTPTITSLANGTWVLDTDGDAALTVDATVIDNNPGENILFNEFATTSGVTTAINVRTTGSAVNSWRYNVHYGDVDGESFDADNGDPGYIVWDNSTTTYTIGGTVFQSDRSTVSSVCGGTPNIVMAVNNVVVASTTCNGSGVYEFDDINFDGNDIITVYINDETPQAVAVTKDPISSIVNMNLYEDHVIVRHENTDPIAIADMSVWDSSDDADIPFTAVDAGTDTLTLPADRQLIVWTNKDFAPGGNVTLSGGGAGDAQDGTLELFANSSFVAANTESHAIGGNLTMAAGASFAAASSSVTFTSDASGRTIDANANSFFDLDFNGAGDWTITDTTLSVAGDISITNGTVTFPTGTSTIAGSFTNSDTFINNGSAFVFTAVDAGNSLTFDGNDVASLTFTGPGGWVLLDVNATSTGTFTNTSGTVTLPSGSLGVGGNFINTGTLVSNNGTVRLTRTSGANILTLDGEDLGSLEIAGGAVTTMTDASATLLGSLEVASGTLAVATNTLTIGGSLDATGGVMQTASGTILFNSSAGIETVNPGTNEFYNVVFGSATGQWTLQSATTTNIFALTAAQSFTLASGQTLAVNGVFTNNVGGTATAWSNTRLRLLSGTEYEVNDKTDAGDAYEVMEIGPNTDVRMWSSNATTTEFTANASLYSQDHGGSNGVLTIYGDFAVATRTEYWSYETDFDGTDISGSPRAASVYLYQDLTSSSSVTVSGSGSLEMIGGSSATSSVQSSSSTLTYAFSVTGGTFNANYYSFDGLDSDGLAFTGTPTITSLSNGSFEMATLFGNLISLSNAALSANAPKTVSNVRFNSSLGGNNVNLSGTTTNAWRFTDSYGDRSGEDYDVDGATECGSIRWDDSLCQLLQQTQYRWRNDDGGEGAPNSEWFDADWDKRKRITVINNDALSYATTAVRVTITHEAAMQSDFEDLRFTTSNGVTELPYWVERYTDSDNATVWLPVYDLPADGQTDLFVYYDNILATSTASSGAVFAVIDDFEDDSISEYSGDTTKFQTDTTFAYGGTYGVEPVVVSDFTNDGIARFDQTVSQGQKIRYFQYVNTAGTTDEACALFGVQSPVTSNQNYAVCLEQFMADRIALVRNAERSDNYGSVVSLASKNVTFSTGWYEVIVDWQTDDTIDVSLYTDAGTLVATTSATDSTYTSGGYGFTYWGQRGGWDDLVAYDRTDTEPTIRFGVEQTDGGATYVAAQNTPGSGFDVNEVARLRVAIENTGLDKNDQEFLLEFAPRGEAASCASVSDGDYDAVPAQGSCGLSGICMATTSNFTSGASTTDLLSNTLGDFSPGYMIESPDTMTNQYDILEDQYTELEYAVTITNNAADDAYCLRVTNNGTLLDSYDVIAELSLQFDPVLGAVSFNDGTDISLVGGTTTRVYASTTVTDLNGYADLGDATSTMYTTLATAACSANNNDCYITTTNSSCSYSGCAGNSCELACYADFYYHADATFSDGGNFWQAFIEVSDQSGGVAYNTSPSIDVLELNALDVLQSINYGSLEVASTTGAYNPTTTIQNIGNIPIDINLEGTDLTNGSSNIPANYQRFATSSFNYDTCSLVTECTELSTSTITGYELDLTKPTSTSPAVEDSIYWGIEIPFGVSSDPYTGINTFYAVTD